MFCWRYQYEVNGDKIHPKPIYCNYFSKNVDNCTFVTNETYLNIAPYGLAHGYHTLQVSLLCTNESTCAPVKQCTTGYLTVSSDQITLVQRNLTDSLGPPYLKLKVLENPLAVRHKRQEAETQKEWVNKSYPYDYKYTYTEGIILFQRVPR